MRLDYFPDTDSLYIDLAGKPGVESREVSDNVVLDFGADGTLVGIDIDLASACVDLTRLMLLGMPSPTRDDST